MHKELESRWSRYAAGGVRCERVMIGFEILSEHGCAEQICPTALDHVRSK
jgi:hypothetical protein